MGVRACDVDKIIENVTILRQSYMGKYEAVLFSGMLNVVFLLRETQACCCDGGTVHQALALDLPLPMFVMLRSHYLQTKIYHRIFKEGLEESRSALGNQHM